MAKQNSPLNTHRWRLLSGVALSGALGLSAAGALAGPDPLGHPKSPKPPASRQAQLPARPSTHLSSANAAAPHFTRSPQPRGADSDALQALGATLGMGDQSVSDPCLHWEHGKCVQTALSSFFQSLDAIQATNAQSRTVVFGNSLIVSDRIVDIWRRRFQTRFGDAGRGFLLADRMARWGARSRTSDVARHLSTYNVVFGERGPYPEGIGAALHVTGRHASATWHLDSARHLRLFWLDHKSAPTLSLRFDDGKPILVVPQHKKQARISSFDVPVGAENLTLTSSKPRGVLYGISLEGEKPGILLDNMAVVGCDSTHFLRQNPGIFAAQLSALKPNLVTLLLGGNEIKRIAWGHSNIKRVRRDLQRFIARIHDATPKSSCLVVGPIENVYGGQPRANMTKNVRHPWRVRPQTQSVRRVMREVALEQGCAFYDLYAALGGPGQLRRLNSKHMLHEDMIHPKGLGLDLIGELISDALLDRYETQPTAPPYPLAAAPNNAPAPAARQFQLVLEERDVTLVSRQGETVLELPARFTFNTTDGPATLSAEWKRTSMPSLPQAVTDDASALFVAQAENDTVRVQFALSASTAHPLLHLNVDVTYKKEVTVLEESYSAYPQNSTGRLLDRAYRRRVLDDTPVFSGRFTPHQGTWRTPKGPAFALLDDDSAEGLWATNDTLVFEFDNAANHPHSTYQKCFASYDRHHPYHDVVGRRRTAGEQSHYHITFVAGDAHPPQLERWPDGRKAAFTLVDHADKANARTLRTLMYGASNRWPSARHPGHHGLMGHGIHLTQTAFSTSSQLQNRHFRKLAWRLSQAGSEIAPHSVTPFVDSIPVIQKKLKRSYAAFAPRTWVDHQPDTNCEAINNQGGARDSASNITQILLQNGIGYAWEAPDLGAFYGLNLLRPSAPQVRVSPLYPADTLRPGGLVGQPTKSLWLFQSLWAWLPRQVILPRWRARKLDALQRDRGLHIAHTYLHAFDPADPYISERSAFVESPKGVLKLRPDFERTFAELGRRQSTGTLWVTPMGPLGDWLQSFSRARLKPISAHHVALVFNANPLGTLANARHWSVAPAKSSVVEAINRRGEPTSLKRRAPGDILDVKPFLFAPDLGISAASPPPAKGVANAQNRPSFSKRWGLRSQLARAHQQKERRQDKDVSQ